MSRPVEEIEADLIRARSMCSGFARARDTAGRDYEDAMRWIGELRQELDQAKKEAGHE